MKKTNDNSKKNKENAVAKRSITNGTYLRILRDALISVGIEWFLIDEEMRGMRGLYREDGRWIVHDRPGFRLRPEDRIDLTEMFGVPVVSGPMNASEGGLESGSNVLNGTAADDVIESENAPARMERLCHWVIEHVAYDEEEKKRMEREFRSGIEEENLMLKGLYDWTLHEETDQLGLPEVYSLEMDEYIRGYLGGHQSLKTLWEIYNRIRPCSCGGKAELHELSGMGDVAYKIRCKSCTRSLCEGGFGIFLPADSDVNDSDEANDIYKNDLHDPNGKTDKIENSDKPMVGSESFEDRLLNVVIYDWNHGMTQEDADRMRSAECARKTVKARDLVWKDYYSGNIVQNGLEGCYSLVFYKDSDGKLCCRKWTIVFQPEEDGSAMISSHGRIDAYLLFAVDYSEIKGKLHYPKPFNWDGSGWKEEKGYHTFSGESLYDRGEFVHAYRTLEEAKAGALARCGWCGIDRDSLIKVKGEMTASRLRKEMREPD